MTTAFPIKLVIDPATTPLVYRELAAIGSARQRAARLRMLAEIALRMEAAQQGPHAWTPERHHAAPTQYFAPPLANVAHDPLLPTQRAVSSEPPSVQPPTVANFETDEIADQMAAFD